MGSGEPGVATDRPTVRVIHQLARSGGTVIGKCLATMDKLVLLSENHPNAFRIHAQYNPIVQVNSWYGLLTPAELEGLDRAGRRIPFADEIALIEQRCRERGLTLVIRDWTHLDYIGVPFTRPTYRLSTREALATRFHLVTTATVRHPIDQWLSQENAPTMRGKQPLADFLRGYRLFAEIAAGIGFIRFEDFTRDPDGQLRKLCDRLDAAFDPGYRQRWKTYKKITGDVQSTRNQPDIQPTPRRPLQEGLLARFEASPDYRASLKALGYGHPE